MSLSHPVIFTLAAAVAIAIALNRRQRWLPGISAICLAIAAGGPSILTRPVGTVDVMVDVSPSTRGASFHSRSVLQHRVAELVGHCHVRWIQFADGSKPLSIDEAADSIAEIASEQTRLDCGHDNPVLLFSDGNFTDVDASLPIFPVIDPNLEAPQDSSVQAIETDGDDSTAIVQNSHAENVLRWNADQSVRPPIGRSRILVATRPGEITASIDGHDRWPENDSLTVFSPSQNQSQRWWIGGMEAPSGFDRESPAAFPVDASALVSVSLVVLDDVPASSFDQNQQAALSDYVHNFGGGLLMIFGPNSAAGRQRTESIEQLSPLSLDPPTPQQRWIALLDRSGSMAVETNGASRFQQARVTAERLIDALPSADLVSIGDFADSLSWIIRDANAQDAAALLKPPANRFANGPTNLDAALRKILAQVNGELPTQLVIISDGQAQIDDAAGLAAKFIAAHVSVSLLDRSSDQPDAAVKHLVASTGGSVVGDDQAASWAGQLMARAATTRRQDDGPSTVRFDLPIRLPLRAVSQWIPSWLKHDAIEITQNHGPKAARWSVGLGSVVAVSFQPDDEEIAAFQKLIHSDPTDPNEHVEWTDFNPLTVEAFAQGTKKFSLVLGNDRRQPMLPMGPGVFRAVTTAPASPIAAVVLDGQRVVSRRMLAGRYPIEFQHIGNDRAALQQLADRTGGKLILPNQHSPIDFHWPARSTSFASAFAAVAMISLAWECLIRRT